MRNVGDSETTDKLMIPLSTFDSVGMVCVTRDTHQTDLQESVILKNHSSKNLSMANPSIKASNNAKKSLFDKSRCRPISQRVCVLVCNGDFEPLLFIKSMTDGYKVYSSMSLIFFHISIIYSSFWDTVIIHQQLVATLQGRMRLVCKKIMMFGNPGYTNPTIYRK